MRVDGSSAEPNVAGEEDDVVLGGIDAIGEGPVDGGVIVDVDIVVDHRDVLVAQMAADEPHIALATCLAWPR